MNIMGRQKAFWQRGLTVALFASLLFLAAFALIARGKNGDGEKRPNIILISIDTLRADHISGYGYDRQTTPFIDSLIRRGTSFANAISPAPWTLPAHMSLFTSLYPHTHGVADNTLALNDDIVTFPMLLKRHGYRTGGFASCPYLFPGYGFDRGFDVYIQRNLVTAPEVYREASEWLFADEAERFFLFLHLYDVHAPHNPREKYIKMFDSSYSGKFNGGMEDLMAVLDGSLSFSEEDRRHLMALYDGEIRQLDESLAVFLNALRNMGYLDNTVLILLSDHGEEFFDHGGVLHSRTLYDELIKIPLVLVGPGIPAGQSVEQQVQLIDVMPTILDICGIKEPRGIAGKSLLPLLTGAAADWEQVAFAEADKENEERDTLRAVRTGAHKFYFNRLSGDEYLFDLTLDPSEQTDILDAEPELGELHREMLREWMKTKKGRPKTIDFQEHKKDLLRSLGYLK